MTRVYSVQYRHPATDRWIEGRITADLVEAGRDVQIRRWGVRMQYRVVRREEEVVLVDGPKPATEETR